MKQFVYGNMGYDHANQYVLLGNSTITIVGINQSHKFDRKATYIMMTLILVKLVYRQIIFSISELS